MMKTTLFAVLAVILLSYPAHGEERGPIEAAGLPGLSSDAPEVYGLPDIIETALKNNPDLAASKKRVMIDGYGIGIARGERMPAINLNGGMTRSRYAQPITPISGVPTAGGFPEFDESIYDFSVSFTMPLYRGGRIERSIRIAEIRKAASEDNLSFSRQDLVYNLTSVYYKISQLERLLEANNATVRQLEEHKKNIELNMSAGTAPKVDLLKAEAELSHARQSALVVKNNLEGSRELMKALMGIDMDRNISIAGPPEVRNGYPGVQESIAMALSQRPDYKAVSKEKAMAKERVELAQGKRLPSVNLNGEYGDRSGADFGFEENWFVGVRFSLPVFDGGIIRSEISRERLQAEIARDRERGLRNEVIRQVRDAHLGIRNASERVTETLAAIDTAKENLRIERLKYSTGGGTSSDVLDAETVLLRAETDYYQALFDKATAVAALERAMGEEYHE